MTCQSIFLGAQAFHTPALTPFHTPLSQMPIHRKSSLELEEVEMTHAMKKTAAPLRTFLMGIGAVAVALSGHRRRHLRSLGPKRLHETR